MAKYDAGNAISGAISGGSVGSIFGPVGTGVGALVGGIGSLFGSKKKKAKKPKQLSTLDPQQQGLYNDYVKSIRGQGPFSNMYNFDAEGYNNVFDQTTARPAYRDFQEKIVPQVTGQFRKNNLMNSSYAADALARRGRDVQENLDSERARNIFQGQQQSNVNRQNAIQNVLNTNTFDYQQPGAQKPNTIDQILGSVGPQAGQWFGDFLSSMRT